jgi:hypothetical protein
MWKARLKTESQNRSININQTVDDVRDIRKKRLNMETSKSSETLVT